MDKVGYCEVACAVMRNNALSTFQWYNKTRILSTGSIRRKTLTKIMATKHMFWAAL